MRCRLHRDPTGVLVATSALVQDSSMIGVLARADALLVRPADAPAAAAGGPVSIIRLNLSARTV
jgi:molybdopterin molybdotransferase